MAIRLEKGIELDKTQLLNMLQNHDSSLAKNKEISMFGPSRSFLEIRAIDIDRWANGIEARHLLPVVIRRLINSSADEVLHSSFPGYDRSEEHGWDGELKAKSRIYWVPDGHSFWELGTSNNPQKKANDDYGKRTKELNEDERKKSTFVFVTPRLWSKSKAWAEQRQRENKWKKVLAFDANDLEQWIERSVQTQVWFAGHLNIPRDGVQTQGEFYTEWSESTRTPISPKNFSTAIEEHKETFKSLLKDGSDDPVIITAYSKREALLRHPQFCH